MRIMMSICAIIAALLAASSIKSGAPVWESAILILLLIGSVFLAVGKHKKGK